MDDGILVFIDYSGTLCFDSVRFGTPGVLMKELISSGLHGLGVRDTDFFWERIIHPVWAEGSTTGAGYGALMERQLKETLPMPVPKDDLRRAVMSFTGRYFGSFRVDPKWKSSLCSLRNNPATSVVVVTDHYAEATKAVIESFRTLGLEARALGTRPPKGPEGAGRTPFLVANSADLGWIKADRRFWELLRASVPCYRNCATLLVDDFGFNEAGGSDYGTWPRVLERRFQTVALVEDVFGSPPRVVTFFADRTTGYRGDGSGSPALVRSLGEVIRDVERVVSTEYRSICS
jgi:hypothetical protein